jgi:hypothetical protein
MNGDSIIIQDVENGRDALKISSALRDEAIIQLKNCL